jgi:SAM-dependent methyltransferase
MFWRRLARVPSLAIRQLRWQRGAWSKDSDRHYHEQLYDAQDYDAFSPDYPGYLTIRRFADHVGLLLPSAGTVLDVGCGPGEITCELARRHPQLAFVGIDHSAQAIARATRNAARLSLANVRFAVGDAEQLPPQDTYALVTMFDAFHHLERPRDFLGWLRTRTTRCVLIEPAGTWSGGWARGLDFDWLLGDLASIRDRIESACGLGMAADAATTTDTAAAPDAPERGEGAVERRYALDDFVSFFDGWHLRITGTIAGFDTYPPRPHARSPLRPVAGDVAYALIRATEELLQQQYRDGAAKHWVIAATTEAGVIEPRLPSTPRVSATSPTSQPAGGVKSAFDVRYLRYDGPTQIKAGAQFRATVEIQNLGWDTWRSDSNSASDSNSVGESAPVRVSYHWLSTHDEMREFDGVRSNLPRPVGPGDTCAAFIAITAPATPGEYRLAIDLVKEGVTWFSEAGVPWYVVRLTVI